MHLITLAMPGPLIQCDPLVLIRDGKLVSDHAQPRRGVGLEALEWLANTLEGLSLEHHIIDFDADDETARMVLDDHETAILIEALWTDRNAPQGGAS